MMTYGASFLLPGKDGAREGCRIPRWVAAFRGETRERVPQDPPRSREAR